MGFIKIFRQMLRMRADPFDQIVTALLYGGLGFVAMLRPDGTVLKSIYDSFHGLLSYETMILTFGILFGLCLHKTGLRLWYFALLFTPLLVLICSSFYFTLKVPTASFVPVLAALAFVAMILKSSFFKAG